MDIQTVANNLVLLSHDGPWGDSEYWWIGRLVMLILVVLLFACLFWWTRRNGWRHHEPTPLERGQAILAERFARGEIDGEEYRERMSQLIS
jgi:putative membrane protein